MFQGKTGVCLEKWWEKNSLFPKVTVIEIFVIPPTEMAKHADDVISQTKKRKHANKQSENRLLTNKQKYSYEAILLNARVLLVVNIISS